MLPPAKPLPFPEFVALIALLMALPALSIDMMLPGLPEIGMALNVTNPNDRQLVVTLYMAGLAIGQLFCGPLADRLGRRPVLLGGIAVFILGALVALMAGSFPALLAARMLQGFGAASPRVLAVAIVRDLYAGRQMARVLSLAMTVFIAVPMVAPAIGQVLVYIASWRWMFVVLLAVGGGAAVWVGLRLPETQHAQADRGPRAGLGASIKAVLGTKQTMAYGTALGFMMGCMLSYIASAQQVFVDVYGLGAAFPLVFSGLALALAAAAQLNARIVVRLGMRFVSHVALAAFVIITGLIAAISALGTPPLPIFLGCLAIAIFMIGLIISNFNALAMEPQGESAGTASSIVGAMSTAIGVLVAHIVGRAFDGTPLPLTLGLGLAGLAACAAVAIGEGRAGILGSYYASPPGHKSLRPNSNDKT